MLRVWYYLGSKGIGNRYWTRKKQTRFESVLQSYSITYNVNVCQTNKINNRNNRL